MAQAPEAYNNVIRNFPGRQDQIDLLLRLFRRVSLANPSRILV